MHARFAAQFFGCIGLLVTLLSWKPQRHVFLDKICISQSDPELKKAGINSLGAFLKHSESMLILWDPTYISRLWTTFELAAFTYLQKIDPKKRIYTRPITQGLFVSVWFVLIVGIPLFAFVVAWFAASPEELCGRLISLQHWCLPTEVNRFDFDIVRTAAGLPFFVVRIVIGVAFVFAFPYWRRFAREADTLSRDLNTFSIRSTRCFCCSCGHRHPASGEMLPCDRRLVESHIEAWFGSLDNFDAFVHREIQPKFTVQCVLPYRLAILCGVPELWLAMGEIAWAIKTGMVDREIEDAQQQGALFGQQYQHVPWIFWCVAWRLQTGFVVNPLLINTILKAASCTRARGSNHLWDGVRSVLAILIMVTVAICHESIVIWAAKFGPFGVLAHTSLLVVVLVITYRERLLA